LLQAGNEETFRTIARDAGIDWFFTHSSIKPPAWIAENAVWHQGNAYILAAGRGTR
jgi:hypothetical protein